jgi:hypothetical protein
VTKCRLGKSHDLSSPARSALSRAFSSQLARFHHFYSGITSQQPFSQYQHLKLSILRHLLGLEAYERTTKAVSQLLMNLSLELVYFQVVPQERKLMQKFGTTYGVPSNERSLANPP